MPVTYEASNFKRQYLDEYTGEPLPPKLLRAAVEDELNYFNSKVWQLTTIEKMKAIPEHIFVRSRWVLCNKGDLEQPDVRARLVCCELNQGDRNDFFSACTPPLEAKRMLRSSFATRRVLRDGRPLQIPFVDIKNAYFNCVPKRCVYLFLSRKSLALVPKRSPTFADVLMEHEMLARSGRTCMHRRW